MCLLAFPGRHRARAPRGPFRLWYPQEVLERLARIGPAFKSRHGRTPNSCETVIASILFRPLSLRLLKPPSNVGPRGRSLTFVAAMIDCTNRPKEHSSHIELVIRRFWQL